MRFTNWQEGKNTQREKKKKRETQDLFPHDFMIMFPSNQLRTDLLTDLVLLCKSTVQMEAMHDECY